MSTSGRSGSTHSTDDADVSVTLPTGAIPTGVAKDGRIWVHLHGSVLRPSGPIRARATDSFQGMPDASGTNWKNLTEEMKDLYFDEFVKAFCWQQDKYTRHQIKKAWISEARVAYNDYISACKKTLLLHKKKIESLNPIVEAAWRAYWALPETQARSAQASKNRRSEPCGVGTGMAIHHGGSRSALDHAEHLARESNIPFDAASWATFRRIHFKNGQYTAGRPAQHGLEVERRVAELREIQGEVTPADVDRIFREVVTPDPKGRIMGLGMMMSKALTSGDGESSTSTSTSHFDAPSKAEFTTLREDLDTTASALTRAVQEIEARRQREEEQARTIQEMQSQIALLMRGFRPSTPSDETHPDL
ncbi:uncharacterized protein LOC131019598 [Salvia miltiorrhiza]|uniref:uncharacterized protein LOC131019598 n=1 Tax=Salvia miltiorrhiza TaxID=226208 RepID=UPI0025AD748C|nr:uncharacterized protein LOC131019598 [Salvia miltiorrhiza]XP_057804162.1 uncharacterized protein LOC131019598 [Salvia miltiorrhiza]XP_057804163.1 uncharacterized protein LOC131019598 [Salvia miltiorrhiza]